MQRILQVAVVVLVIAVVVLGWRYFRTPGDGPQVTEAKKLLTTATDGRKASSIRDQAGPQELQCDRTTPYLKFFDSNDNAPKIWYSKDVSSGHISCWDREGYDPYTGEALNPVIDKGAGSNGIRKEIIQQPPAVKYLPRPTPVPPPQVQYQPQARPIVASPPPRITPDSCSGGCTTEWGPATRQIDSWPQGQ